ncbi:MAG: hypothetical protein DME76_19840 [Verrucomicrobia bacterium]|nr:MAG: hypothetical protein DME76_19840 [Verrucomicrobiota bacterium]
MLASASRDRELFINSESGQEEGAEKSLFRRDAETNTLPRLLSAHHPMKGQRWHEEEEYQHHAQQDKKEQNQSAEFFPVDSEEVRRPGCGGVPKQKRRPEVEKGEYKANDKCGEEKVAKENDFFAVHTRHYSLRQSQINHIWLRAG